MIVMLKGYWFDDYMLLCFFCLIRLNHNMQLYCTYVQLISLHTIVYVCELVYTPQHFQMDRNQASKPLSFAHLFPHLSHLINFKTTVGWRL